MKIVSRENIVIFEGERAAHYDQFIPIYDGAKLQLLQSIGNRLRPGSPLVLVDIFREPGTFERYLHILEKHLEQSGVEREWINDGLTHIRNDIQAVPGQRMIELLQEAGFGNILRFSQHLMYGGWVAEKV